MRSVTREIWLINESMDVYNRGCQAHELGQGLHWANKDTNTHTSKQINEPIQTQLPSTRHPTLHLGCSAFMSLFFSPPHPQFLCLFFYPHLVCVWTRPLGANSLPWTPSAVWLSTVNWAWLVVSGREGAVLSPVQCEPPSAARRRLSPEAPRIDGERVWRKGCLSSLSTSLIWFSVLND